MLRVRARLAASTTRSVCHRWLNSCMRNGLSIRATKLKSLYSLHFGRNDKDGAEWHATVSHLQLPVLRRKINILVALTHA